MYAFLGRGCLVVPFCLAAVLLSARPAPAQDELSSERVLRAIERGKRYLVSQQNADGSWTADGLGHKVGVSGLCLLSLLNSGMTVDDPPVRKGLAHLRSVKEPEPEQTYDISLMLMALAAAKDGTRDKSRMITLADKLERLQFKGGGENAGGWGYGAGGGLTGRADRSNTQFAILALRDAVHAGVKVKRSTWELGRRYWIDSQNGDGGWGYSQSHRDSSYGSMTVAGVATLVITEEMLREDDELDRDGKPKCCPTYPPRKELERGIAWLERNFTVEANPGPLSMRGAWTLYYLYGLERAGRLSGRRLFGARDWYREGARTLVKGQSGLGYWKGNGFGETEEVVGTGLALLFLSKGLSPVLVNKLKYGPPDRDDPDEVAGDNWNRHRYDVRNLTEHVSTLEKWPRLLSWQTVEMRKLVKHGGVEELLQAPVLFISGRTAPDSLKDEDQAGLLREYIVQGGFIFASGNCERDAGFDQGFRELVASLKLEGEPKLRRLDPDHPVYRSEYNLRPDAENIELWGLDYG